MFYVYFFLRQGKFSVKNVTPTKDGESSKIKVKIRMDIHGIFYVSKAQMIEKIPSDDESELMETQPATTAESSDKNNADAQNGTKDGAQVQYCPELLNVQYSQSLYSTLIMLFSYLCVMHICTTVTMCKYACCG